MTPTQQAGIAGTNAAAGVAQPFYQAGTGLTMQGSQAVGPLTKEQIGYYQDPYVQSVVDPTRAALEQQQGQQRAQMQAAAIKSGAAFGDRDRLARNDLMRQQSLGMAQAINPLYSQAYQTGVQTAAGQQGVVAADLQRKLAAGQQIAGLGTGAQGAALQGAQQQLAAGTAEQQTQQADLTARYQQFLQQQGYPFQVSQFLANIAMGTGALSGSTTTTQQPTGFFSDRRLKHDVHEIGKTHDGQPIYSFKYNGDNKTQIGLMAQDVEKHHPEAVGVMGGYKTVDYDKATEDAQRPERAMGGVIPNSMGGGVWHPDAYAGGGLVDGDDMKAILQAQQAGFGPWGGGLYGGAGAGVPGAKSQGIVPQASLPVPKLVTASPAPARQQSGLSQAASVGSNIASTGRAAVDFKNWVSGLGKDSPKPATTQTTPETKDIPPATKPGVAPSTTAKPTVNASLEEPPVSEPITTVATGGVIPYRHHRAGGGINPYKLSDDMSYIPESVLKEGEEEADQASGQFKKNTGQGGAGGQQGGGLGQALGTASSLMTVGKGLGQFASWLPTLFLHDGGVVPRQHFNKGGDAEGSQTPTSEDVVRAIMEKQVAPAEGGNNPQSRLTGPNAINSNAAGSYGMLQRVWQENADKAGIPWREKGWLSAADAPHDVQTQVMMQYAVPHARKLEAAGLPVHGGTMRAMNFGPAWVPQVLKMPDDTVLDRDTLVQAGWDPKNLNAALENSINRKVLLNDDKSPKTVGQLKDYFFKGSSGSRGPGVVSDSAPIGRASTLGDVFSKITPESIPSNENFWIPALAGVGSMLASTRPTFLGALGEGLVGGVSGYQTMQKQHAEMAKGVMDLIKDRFVTGVDKNGNTTFYDKVQGKFVDPSYPQKVAASMITEFGGNPKAYGYGTQPTSPSAPTAP
jgi:hypothetical protein